MFFYGERSLLLFRKIFERYFIDDNGIYFGADAVIDTITKSRLHVLFHYGNRNLISVMIGASKISLLNYTVLVKIIRTKPTTLETFNVFFSNWVEIKQKVKRTKVVISGKI